MTVPAPDGGNRPERNGRESKARGAPGDSSGDGDRRDAPSMETLTPSERTMRARLAAYTMHSRHDSREITAPARRAFLARFEEEVDPNRRLPSAERQRRAEAARKAYFSRLALKSAQARRRRKG